ncbi:MAG: TonB-dependent siderophore receptor [Pseudomonadota bacterium]
MRHDAWTAILLGTTSGLVMLNSAVSAQEATALETIVVTAQENAAEDNEDILAKSSASATKTNTPIIETPQSISVVTRGQLDEQNPQTVSEALRYTSGVLSDRDATSRYNSVFLRGFGGFGTSTNFVNFLDGLKLQQGQAFAQPAIDPYLLNRIEVLKGPSAVLYGQTSPGGLVNQISRVPSAEPFNEIRLEAGTHGRVKGGVTSRGSLNKDGSLQYGVSAFGLWSGTRYDDVNESRLGIAPALTWQPYTDTTLTLSGYYQNDPDGGYFNSLYPRFLAPNAYRPYLDRELNVGDPDFDSYERQEYGIGYSFEHRFNEFVAVRSKARYTGIDSDLHGIQMAGPIDANGNIPRAAVQSIEDASGLSFDSNAEFNFETGAIAHTVLAGLDLQNATSNWEYLFGAAPSLNVVNPQYGQPIGPFATFINNEQKLSQTGVYLQDQISFKGLRGVLGVRHDWTKQDTHNRIAGSSSDQSSDATSYRAGLLYLFENGLAPYASYSTSFEPVIGVDASGDPFVPTEAEQFEIGLKYEPAFMDALITISAFDIRQKNVLTPGPVPGFNVQTGEIRSRGLEFEVRGNVTSNLEVIGALTLLDTEVTESNTPSAVGKRPQAVPDYFASIWADYAFNSGFADGLKIGGGVRVVGSSYADDANTAKVDGYTLVDAAMSYDFGVINPKLEGLQATLNITNVFDEDYYSSCSFDIYCQFGDGRRVLAGLRYTW